MPFHSFTFFGFFIIVFLVYISINHRLQNRFLLVASYVFYSYWDWRFLSLILISTITDFFCAIKIDKLEKKAEKKRYVALSLCINLGILGFFKYFNFFAENFLSLVGSVGLNLDVTLARIILPVGISFYTFQSISYTVDVYRGQLKPTKNFFDYALYVSFFPQLVAGPIERGKNLLPQIIKPRVISHEQLKEGIFLIFLGLFKKLVLAENLATIVNPIFKAHGDGSGGLVLVAAYAFLLQVYCDFSSYTDFARGTAKMMGIEIMENFRAPYFATNIQELWNRWHISLTTWIRDYLYYPLAFKRFGKRSINVRLLTVITFLIMGLWHGAAWNFVFWGGYHGTVLALYSYWVFKKKKIKKTFSPFTLKVLSVLSVILTFHVGTIGVIFFRTHSFEQTFDMLNALFFNFEINAKILHLFGKYLLYSAPMFAFDIIELKMGNLFAFFKKYKLLRYAIYYAMLYLLVFYNRQSSDFIYFQF